ncbi:MAG: glutamyl-tRNA reductase [Actinomycetaceae bacterium]
MPLVLLSADHHSVTLDDLERLSVGAGSLPAALTRHPAVSGAVVLTTCNRVELYLDATDADHALEGARRALSAGSGVAAAEVGALTAATHGDEVVQHLFEVAGGLDAMVVGEREIVGQVRRALEDARAVGATTPDLEELLQRASKASRRVAVATDLAAAGRSVVSVALDLAAHVARGVVAPGAAAGEVVDGATATTSATTSDPTAALPSSTAPDPACPREADAPPVPGPRDLPRASWAGARALVVGTGAYAGATLAALRRRECSDIRVWSASGRAERFAAEEDVRSAGDLAVELAEADVVVTCRGTGVPVVDETTLGAALEARRAAGRGEALVVVDLALRHDVTPAAAALDGVRVIDLDTVKAHAPAATDGQVHRAQEVLAEEVRAVVATRAEREMDEVVLAVRDRVGAALEDELGRLPMGGTVPADDAARALRRLAARLAHPPTVAARAAGREGRGEEFTRALELVTGIAVGDGAAAGAAAATDPGAPGATRRRNTA